MWLVEAGTTIKKIGISMERKCVGVINLKIGNVEGSGSLNSKQ